MKNLYIVTGANGHLGSTLVRMLQRRGAEVRGCCCRRSRRPATAA